MNIWELSLSDIDFTTFKLLGEEKVDQLREFVELIGRRGKNKVAG